jgi:hypothetical protein
MFARWFRRPEARPRHESPSFRPQLESLEDRLTPGYGPYTMTGAYIALPYDHLTSLPLGQTAQAAFSPLALGTSSLGAMTVAAQALVVRPGM